VNVILISRVRDIRSNESAESSTGWLSRVREPQVLTNGGLLRVLEGNSGEGLDGKVGSLRARPDELSSQGEYGAGPKSSVESSRNGLSASGDSDESLVASLNGDDGSGGGKDVGRVDKRCGSKVGRNTDGFEHTCSLDHGIGTRQSSIEVVLTGLNGLGASCSNSGDEGGDVSSFGLANTHQGLDLRFSKA
jgi:hypothetical protein